MFTRLSLAPWFAVVFVAGGLDARAQPPAGGTFLYLTSQAGDPIGEGLVQTFTTDNATISAYYNETDVFFNVAPSTGGVYTLELSAPPGQPLVEGTYLNAARSPFRSFGQPGIDVTHNSTGCNTESGSFVVTQAQYGPFGPNGYHRVLLFDATFQVSCDGLPPLSGEIRFEEQPDRTPPTLVLPSDITTEANVAGGAVVYFFAYALDDRDSFPPVTCDPPSASTFPIGTTTVMCTTSDSAGNQSNGSFTVTVLAALQLTLKISTVGSVDPKAGVAVIQGTVACSRDSSVFVYGQFTQEIAQRATLTGSFAVPVQCAAPQSSWSATIGSSNGRYKPGKAHAIGNGVSCFFSCHTAQADQIVVLKGGGPTKSEPR